MGEENGGNIAGECKQTRSFTREQCSGELKCRQASVTTLLTKYNMHKAVELSVRRQSKKGKEEGVGGGIKHLLIDLGISEAALIICFCY